MATREDGRQLMIDNFAIAISHGLMFLAAVLLLTRRDLDDERPEPPKKPLKRRP